MPLAQVADDDLQLGIAIERAAENHANEMHRGFNVPAPAGAREHGVHGRREPAVQRFHDRLRRHRRVQIDRDIERLGPFQHRPEELVVEIASASMAVDDRAFEALPDPLLQFVGGFFGRRGRQHRNAGEAQRVVLHRLGQEIVGFARGSHLLRPFDLLDARRIERQHLHVDLGGIHLGDSLGADLARAARRRWRRARRISASAPGTPVRDRRQIPG